MSAISGLRKPLLRPIRRWANIPKYWFFIDDEPLPLVQSDRITFTVTMTIS